MGIPVSWWPTGIHALAAVHPHVAMMVPVHVVVPAHVMMATHVVAAGMMTAAVTRHGVGDFRRQLYLRRCSRRGGRSQFGIGLDVTGACESRSG